MTIFFIFKNSNKCLKKSIVGTKKENTAFSQVFTNLSKMLAGDKQKYTGHDGRDSTRKETYYQY